MSKAAFACVVAGALVLALAFRLAGLELRPMHHDEANQAVRFGQLLETGEYRYDSNDHHGPTLYFLTLPAAWARGQATLASLDERTLRMVPALFGAGFILLLALMAQGLGRGAVAMAALLAALSPALTYYSRFYIQEPVLLFFLVGFLVALGRYVERGGVGPALWSGAFAGLAISTKETAGPILIAAVVACAAARASVAGRAPWPRVRFGHALAGAAVAVLAALTFYSSFFTNVPGIAEAVRAGAVYAKRGLEPGTHGESWSYYVSLLAYSSSGGVVWSEMIVLALAAGGAVFAWRRGTDGFWPRYVCLYTVITAAAFSAVRYKTPWNVLPFYGGCVVLAGFGASSLVGLLRSRGARILAGVALLAACGQLGLQDWRANFRYPADQRNPYVYAQTSPDFLKLVTRVADVSAAHPDRARMLVAVVAGPYEQWPLPWYLRRMTRVGYWTSISAAGPLDGVPFLIASPDFAAGLESALGDRYVSEFYGLRPGVLLTVFIERGLWDRFMGMVGMGSGRITNGRPGR
jgi:uncharacterized protein (TIGR03663 family)